MDIKYTILDNIWAKKWFGMDICKEWMKKDCPEKMEQYPRRNLASHML
jgi:hypothetical protein